MVPPSAECRHCPRCKAGAKRPTPTGGTGALHETWCLSPGRAASTPTVTPRLSGPNEKQRCRPGSGRFHQASFGVNPCPPRLTPSARHSGCTEMGRRTKTGDGFGSRAHPIDSVRENRHGSSDREVRAWFGQSGPTRARLRSGGLSVAIRRIVVLVNAADTASAILAWASRLAHQLDATLQLADPAREPLAPAELFVVSDESADSGAHARGFWWALSSRGQATLVVRERHDWTREPIRRILLATDSATDFAGTARSAVQIARAFDAEISVFHAWDVTGRAIPLGPPIPSLGENRVREHALGLVSSARANLLELAPDLTVRMNVQRGPAPERIADEAKRIRADLVAIGRGRKGRALSRVAADTLRQVHCSVLVGGANRDLSIRISGAEL